jgi:hypothetical protein
MEDTGRNACATKIVLVLSHKSGWLVGATSSLVQRERLLVAIGQLVHKAHRALDRSAYGGRFPVDSKNRASWDGEPLWCSASADQSLALQPLYPTSEVETGFTFSGGC